jgi:hypothetical protein
METFFENIPLGKRKKMGYEKQFSIHFPKQP